MGSFNTSCMVSQQVIVPGTEAVILPIMQQATYRPVIMTKDGKEFSQYGVDHTTCYPTAFWAYAGPMIRGNYDDYGRFEVLDTPDNFNNLFSFFDSLIKDSFVTQQGENKHHDHAFDISKIYEPNKEYCFDELVTIWDSVWEVAQQNRMFVSDYDRQPRSLQFAVMHHSAAKYLVESISTSKSYSGQSYDQKVYFKNYVQSQLARMLEVFKDKKDMKQTLIFFSSQLASLSNYGFGNQEGTYLSQYYNHYKEVMDIIELFIDKNPDIKELPDTLIDLLYMVFENEIEHRYIHAGLDSLNLKLSPMVYASQDYQNATGKAYAKMIAAVSTEVVNEIKENNDYEDDEDDDDEEEDYLIGFRQ